MSGNDLTVQMSSAAKLRTLSAY